MSKENGNATIPNLWLRVSLRGAQHSSGSHGYLALEPQLSSGSVALLVQCSFLKLMCSPNNPLPTLGWSP